MKKKFSLWLNIATICLCVCAIAIGVYSAQSATLKVTGSIGFTAHGVEATVQVKMSGHAKDKDDKPVASKETIKDTTEVTNDLEIPLGSFWFSDLADDGVICPIVIEFIVTNNSTAIDILVESVTAEDSICTATGVTATLGEKAYIKKKTGSTAETGTLTVTLSLNEGIEKVTSETNINMTIKIARPVAKTFASEGKKDEKILVQEFDSDYKNTVRTKTVDVAITQLNKENNITNAYDSSSLCYADVFPYYIEMGQYPSGASIKWLIVGYMQDGVVTPLRDVDKSALSSKILLSDVDYVLLSETILGKLDFNAQSDSRHGNINYNDYYLSDIRNYLTGTGDSDFASAYKLTDIDIKIKPRSTRTLYDDITQVDTNLDKTITGTLTAQSDISADSADSFWLLSQQEVYTLFEKGSSVYVSTAICTDRSQSGTKAWWTRSPYYDDKSKSKFVSDYGNVSSYLTVHVSDIAYVRPAVVI